MKKFVAYSVIALLLFLALFLLYGPEKIPAEYTKITAEQAQTLMADGDPFILLDVRTPEEFAEAHIKTALLLPDYELAARAPAELPDKHARILVYCRSGRRSANAANALLAMGYTNVFDFGGIIDWPFETERGSL